MASSGQKRERWSDTVDDRDDAYQSQSGGASSSYGFPQPEDAAPSVPKSSSAASHAQMPSPMVFPQTGAADERMEAQRNAFTSEFRTILPEGRADTGLPALLCVCYHILINTTSNVAKSGNCTAAMR